MLDIAYELVGQATSNSLLMFCFCNLIIVMIITGSSKPGSTDSQDYTFTTSVNFNMCSSLASQDHDCCDDDDDHEEMIVIDVSSAQDEPLTDASSISEGYEDKESSHCCDNNGEDDDDDDDDNESNETDVEEEEEDDELRKRAEEFIAKVNNEWKHEKLRALSLVY
ncbi:hypothetical protein Rs2_12373 [Raphanus sativus]|uniref:Acidic leucine-rich nuclear phosphoprotein 32-related protein 2 n=1 Tax=Raphanus sativus TaxID=3726 RepID=A0A6J0MR08_RAPSA|nr:acidic leucine-rich nuclear phosphoprotein 32-related protein 2 [Raphanus sativus]KAJ4908715.1 hypothetical protein Rs2_12373 [Raphanus sativus]